MVSKAYVLIKTLRPNFHLLVIAEEDLDGQPTVTADLEAVLEVIKLVDLLISEVPAVNLEVTVNARLANGLGNNAPSLLDTPDEQNLLGSLALLLGDLEKGGILVKGRVGRAEARVSSGVDTLGSVVRNQLGRGVVRVQLDLVDSGHDLGRGVIEELLEVLDAEVGDTDIADLAGGRQLLHLLPGLDEVPVRQVLRQVVGVGGAGPVDQVEIDVVDIQVLQRGGKAILHAVVPGVVQLGGDPDLVAGNAGVLDALADLMFVAIGESSVDVAVALQQGVLDGLAHFIGLGLPGAQADGGDLVARVEGVGLPMRRSLLEREGKS